MEKSNWLAECFEAHHARLRGIAFRMLGSLADADDAVQETWLRLSRSRASEVENLGGWLTTVAARVCLDMLRTRAVRKEEPLDQALATAIPDQGRRIDPEQEALTADAVGLALLVVLDRLTPAERIAFVLHDMFDIPFADIASIVGRSPDAAKKLASRARSRVRGGTIDHGELTRRWAIVEALRAATRDADLHTLLTLLHPDVVRRADRWAIPATAPAELHGARAVAEGVLHYARTATRFARPALVNGDPGLVIAPRGRLHMALTIEIKNNKITQINVIGEPSRLADLVLSLPDFSTGADLRDDAPDQPTRRDPQPSNSRGHDRGQFTTADSIAAGRIAVVDSATDVDGRLTLRDGRTLAWHEWGVPDGIPVLRLQGTPSSRFARHPIWERLGVRVVMADRPGFGASTRMPGRGLASVADDLVELLDHLGLDRVPVIGISGGGPHVLALGARHPARVSAATVVAGAAPLIDADIPLLIGSNARGYRRARDGGWEALYPLLREQREKTLADPLAGTREAMSDAPPEDQAVMSDPAWQQTLERNLTESLRPGAEGWCDECFATSDWDIAPEQVRVHVVWYHSRHDANEPLQAVQRLVDRLPSVDLRLWEGGHLEPFHREEELMRDLLSRAEFG